MSTDGIRTGRCSLSLILRECSPSLPSASYSRNLSQDSISCKLLRIHLQYRRFIAGPTLNNSKKKEVEFFWKLSLNVVENVTKVEKKTLLFLAEFHFSTLINYSTNMCWTSYEPTVTKINLELKRTQSPRLIMLWVVNLNGNKCSNESIDYLGSMSIISTSKTRMPVLNILS